MADMMLGAYGFALTCRAMFFHLDGRWIPAPAGTAIFSAQESERVMRVVRVWQRARTLFRSDEAIAEWLRSPTAALDQAAPLDLLDTDVGTIEVESLITGLAYGNFQ